MEGRHLSKQEEVIIGITGKNLNGITNPITQMENLIMNNNIMINNSLEIKDSLNSQTNL